MRILENMKKFTVDELRGFDGKAGRPAYVGYKGKVYDVSVLISGVMATTWDMRLAET